MKKKNYKRRILGLVLILLLILTVAFGFLMTRSRDNPTPFLLDVPVLSGSQSGVVSLVNGHTQTVYDRVQLGEELQERLSVFSGEKYLLASIGIPNLFTTDENSVFFNPNTVNITQNNPYVVSLITRKIQVVGSHKDYEVVEIPIVKGDYWLRIQKVFLPNMAEWELLILGREINPNRLLHPIYPQELLRFVAPPGTFGPVVEKPVIEEPIVEEPVVEEPVVEEPVVEEPVVEEPPDLAEEPIEEPTGDVTAPTLEEVKEVKGAVKTHFMLDYLYQFGDKGNYAYDNINHVLYKIVVDGTDLQVSVLYSMPGVSVRKFMVEDGQLFFTTAVNDSVYIHNNTGTRKVDAGSVVESWTVDGHILYYAAMEALFQIDLRTGHSDYLYLGDETTDIHVTAQFIYVANRFGSTISKSVVHKLSKDFTSQGWAEIGYAKNTRIVYERNGELLLQQNMHDDADKLVYVDAQLSMRYEVPLKRLHGNITVYSDKYLYGISEGTIHLYNLQGEWLDAINMQVSETLFLK